MYFKTRQSTVRAAIQEGAHIVPIFFFGNTKIFKVLGQNSSESFLAKMSRKLRASVVLFYGRNGLRIVGYDNERGKGDHRHVGEVETRSRFVSAEKLVADFLADIERATNEHDT